MHNLGDSTTSRDKNKKNDMKTFNVSLSFNVANVLIECELKSRSINTLVASVV